MRRFFPGIRIALGALDPLVPRRLLILALLEEGQLAPQREDLLLLRRQRLVEGGDGIFLERQLALQIHQLLLPIICLRHALLLFKYRLEANILPAFEQ